MTHLLIFGDSNTHGTLPAPGPGAPEALGPDDRWAGHLARGLGEGWRVTVDGLPGRTFVLDDPIEGAWKNGLSILPATLEAQAPVDAVAVMLGTNDQKARFSLTGRDIALAARRLLGAIRRFAPGAPILLICPPRVQELAEAAHTFRGAEDRAGDLPTHMAGIALAERAAFFDANTVIATDAADGVHFGPEAHAALGRALIEPVGALA